uniref:AlNc14C459G11780 protein n=1 Tax=Albugo laibachii Nc14 TaxID=890382 RepID=F0X042_9STRA|nr:AlNc14C459G11780 [Albugo laibachii Nc14]|eukprot:CCA27124.1 AlNc14C459G11780 [Albugo laibachii Nc14]
MEKKGKQKKRSDLPPLLGNALEKDRRGWVIGMQGKVFAPMRDVLINKKKCVYAALHGPKRDAGTMGHGNAQIIKSVCNDVEYEAVVSIFGRCARAIIEENAGLSDMFNLDETGFVQNLKTGKGIAVRGSKNVSAQNVERGFHLTMVVCVSADDFVVPPAFILPGKRLNRDVPMRTAFPAPQSRPQKMDS